MIRGENPRRAPVGFCRRLRPEQYAKQRSPAALSVVLPWRSSPVTSRRSAGLERPCLRGSHIRRLERNAINLGLKK